MTTVDPNTTPLPTSQDNPPVPAYRIPYDPTTAQLVDELLRRADALESEPGLDPEPYSDDPAEGHPRPKVRAAWAVKARPFSAFQAAGFSLLRAVCGSDGHPLCRQWLQDVHSPVVYAVRRGAGILEGFLLSWKLGALWTANDEPRGEAGGPGSEGGVVDSALPVPSGEFGGHGG